MLTRSEIDGVEQVPVHWRHELQSSVTAPKIVIADRPFEQARRPIYPYYIILFIYSCIVYLFIGDTQYSSVLPHSLYLPPPTHTNYFYSVS